MDDGQTIRIGHSPDPDDAFMFHALTTGAIDTGRYDYEHELVDIETLNNLALKGHHEVTAVSIHALPQVLDRYVLMNCGASMGEGYGPRLVARDELSIEEARGARIAIPGEMTSAHLALRIAFGDVDTVIIPFDRIMESVSAGDVDIGLVIHEGQLTYREHRLHLIMDLGEWWMERWGLPLPLGGNVIRRDLGIETINTVTEHVRRSIEHAMNHPKDALDFAKQWGRGIDDETNSEFVGMYVNSRTLDYGTDGRRAVRLFLREGQRIGMVPTDLDVDGIEFVGETVSPPRSRFDSVDPAPPSDNDMVDELRMKLCDENARMFERMRSLFALRNIGGTGAVDALAASFGSASALLKHEVAYVMGQMQDPSAVDHLINRLEDLQEDVMVRHEAAEALGAIGDRRAIATLERFVDDESTVIAESCEVALDLLEWVQSTDLEYVDPSI